MQSLIVVVLTTGLRVLDFFVTRPPDNPVIRALVDRLRAVIEEVRSLGQTEFTAEGKATRASRRRATVARDIRYYFLTPIATFARAAFRGDTGQIALFRLPADGSRAQEAILIGARAILANVRANMDALVAQAMDPALPDQLEEILAEYAALPTEINTGKIGGSGAREGLDNAMGEIVALLQQLDAYARHRYRLEPEVVAEWQLARNIPWPKYGKRKAAAKAKAEAKAAAEAQAAQASSSDGSAPS